MRFLPNLKSNQEVNSEFENLVSNLGKVTLVHCEEPKMVVVATKIDDDSLGSDKTSVKCLQIHRDHRVNVSLAMGLVDKDPVYLSIIRKLNQSFLHKYDLNDLDYLDKCQYLDSANRNARGVLSSVLVAKEPRKHKSKLPQNIPPVLPYKPMSSKTRKIPTHSCNQQFQKPETLKQHLETCKDNIAKGENPSREKYAYQEDSTVSRMVSKKAIDDENISYHENNISDHEYHDISDHEYHAISDHEYHAISDHEYHDISDHEYHAISDHEYHAISDHEYHNISDSEYHEISDGEYHNISDSEYHEISDSEYHEISDGEYHGYSEYHEISDGEYHGDSEREYAISNSEHHGVSDRDQYRHMSVTPENHVTITSEEDQPHPMSFSVSQNKDDVENTTDDNKTSQDICIPADLSSLSVKGVGRLLKSFNMTRYAAKFENEQIDGETLVALDENALKSLDLTYFHARKLMKVIAGWRPKNDDKSATPTD